MQRTKRSPILRYTENEIIFLSEKSLKKISPIGASNEN